MLSIVTSIIFLSCNNATDPSTPQSSSFGSLSVQVNVADALIKLKLGGTLLSQRQGSGEFENLLPGNYIMEVSAENYLTDTSVVQIAANNRTIKSVNLVGVFMPMVSIPAGTFIMGCTSEQSNCADDELPTHQVTLSAYSIGKYEVTQKQYREVMGINPSSSVGENKPVEQITWAKAVEFCNSLSRKDGLTPAYTINGSTVTCNFQANGYRLPTEAEWEYAARGGSKSTNTKFSGSNIIDDVAWYGANSSNTTHDVGTKAPNQLGIYDMSGNVYEWCWDWSGSYSSQSVTDPRGPNTGIYRRLRGGSFGLPDNYCRTTYRINGVSAGPIYCGFRVVRTTN